MLISSPQSVAVTGGLLGQVVLMSTVLIFLTRMWQHDVWAVSNGRVCRKRGLVNLSRIDIDTHMLTAAETIRPVWLAIFGAAQVELRAAAPGEKKHISVVLKKDRAARLCDTVMPFCDGEEEADEYAATMRPVAIMAASDSNFALGLLLLIPLVGQIGNALGRDFRTQLWDEISGGAVEALPWVPPPFVWVSVLLALGWLGHFFRNLLVYGNHRTIRRGRTTLLAGGVITRRTVRVPDRAVSALEIRQTLMMRILGRKSCWMLIQGFTNGKHCCLLPAARESDMTDAVGRMFPCAGGGGASVSPGVQERRKYYVIHFVLAAGVVAAWAALALFVSHTAALNIIGGSVLAAVCWSAAVGVMASGAAQIHLTGDSVRIVGRRGMTVISLRVFRGMVGEVRVRQNIFRRMAGLCDVSIRPKGFRKGVVCRFLPLERAMEIAGRLA